VAAPSFTTGNPLLDGLYAILNGISEVPLISSPLTGLLILAGVTLASRRAGFMMFVSSIVGGSVAYVLGAPVGSITFGLFGFNSILTGMAFWSGPFVKSNKTTFVISIVGACVCAVVFEAFSHLFGDMFAGLGPGYSIPGFTISFVFTAWAIMFATRKYGRDIWPPPALKSSTTDALPFEWNLREFIRATLNGVSQVTFIQDWRTGLFWIVGLTLCFELAPVSGSVLTNAYTAGWDPSSWLYLAGFMAFLGSAIGVALGIVAKLPTTEVRKGLHGFNNVLVMIAITSFLPLTVGTFLFAIFATVACTLFTMPALTSVFEELGMPTDLHMPALTGPFVFTTIIFLMSIVAFGHIPGGIGWAKP